MKLTALNEEQHIALKESLRYQSSLVLAGPGSGKTRLITYRLARIVEEELAAPEEIMAVTFTNQAAGEMRDRVALLLGDEKVARKLWISTFHSAAARILRKFGSKIGISRGFAIFDEADSKAILKEILERETGEASEKTVSYYHGWIMGRKEELMLPDEVLQAARTGLDVLKAEIYRIYQELLQDHKALDFADLQLYAVKLLKSNVEVRSQYQSSLRFIMVDEFQDINKAQFELLTLLAGPKTNVCVVGDLDQSIYMFRGANPSFALRFQEEFPDVVVLRLEKCHRSTGTIVEAANKLIQANKKRLEKTSWTERPMGEKIWVIKTMDEYHEAQAIVQVIRWYLRLGLEPKDIAVLYRTNAQSGIIQKALVEAGIPFRVLGQTGFWETREVKDLLAIFELAGGVDTSIGYRRFLILLPGVGERTIEKLERMVQEGASWEEAMQAINVNKRTRAGLELGLATLKGLRERFGTEPPGRMLDEWVKEFGYYSRIPQDIEHITRRHANLQILFAKMDEIFEELGPGRPFEEYRDGLIFQGAGEEGEAVSVMTIHASKGLEFKGVIIAGCEEGLLPHVSAFESEDAMEEERRLFYVGITRAKDYVTLTWAKERKVGGWVEEQMVSRFLSEIPKSLQKRISLARDMALAV